MEFLGISLWLWILIAIWSSIWKALAFWKSARKNNLAWFIVFVLVNTIGVLEILYIYIFSERENKAEKEKKQDKCDHYFLPSGGKWSPEGQKTCQDCGKKIGT
jgi:hypothetical protein